MKSIRKGFTLIELVVVVLIMGILASMSMPYYYKTIETSKATDSLALGQMYAAAYRMFQVDNPNTSLNGTIDYNCNSGNCSPGDFSGCRLIRCNYVAKQDSANASYTYSANNNGISVRRVPTSSPYDAWGYDFNLTGGCSPQGGAPPCPKF